MSSSGSRQPQGSPPNLNKFFSNGQEQANNFAAESNRRSQNLQEQLNRLSADQEALREAMHHRSDASATSSACGDRDHLGQSWDGLRGEREVYFEKVGLTPRQKDALREASSARESFDHSRNSAADLDYEPSRSFHEAPTDRSFHEQHSYQSDDVIISANQTQNRLRLALSGSFEDARNGTSGGAGNSNGSYASNSLTDGLSAQTGSIQGLPESLMQAGAHINVQNSLLEEERARARRDSAHLHAQIITLKGELDAAKSSSACEVVQLTQRCSDLEREMEAMRLECEQLSLRV